MREASNYLTGEAMTPALAEAFARMLGQYLRLHPEMWVNILLQFRKGYRKEGVHGPV